MRWTPKGAAFLGGRSAMEKSSSQIGGFWDNDTMEDCSAEVHDVCFSVAETDFGISDETSVPSDGRPMVWCSYGLVVLSFGDCQNGFETRQDDVALRGNKVPKSSPKGVVFLLVCDVDLFSTPKFD
jgi:hypothetical protein